MGKPVDQIFHKDLKRVIEKTLEGVEVDSFQIQYTSRHGDLRHLVLNFSSRRDSAGNITGGLAVCQDVTENELHDR